MRTVLTGLAMMLVLPLSSVARAACGDAPGDAAAVAAARAAVDATCNCAGSPSHRTYVSCAKGVVRDRVDNNLLSRQCGRTVTRCARRSTCGRPGAVTCCKVTSRGTRCSVRRDAARCTHLGGCVGILTSCCDACGTGGCATTSTTTTSTTTTTASPNACGAAQFPTCGGDCPVGQDCASFVISDPPSPPVNNCLCVPDSQQCGPNPNGFLGCGAGACPPSQVCVFDFFGSVCGCFVQ